MLQSGVGGFVADRLRSELGRILRGRIGRLAVTIEPLARGFGHKPNTTEYPRVGQTSRPLASVAGFVTEQSLALQRRFVEALDLHPLIVVGSAQVLLRSSWRTPISRAPESRCVMRDAVLYSRLTVCFELRVPSHDFVCTPFQVCLGHKQCGLRRARNESSSCLICRASGGHRSGWRASATRDRPGLIKPASRPLLKPIGFH